MRENSEKRQSVEPVTRALRIVEALNLRPVTTLAALHQMTGLPKPTLVRLLDTLIASGYVCRVSRQAGYGLAERVLRLSGGFRHTDQVVEAARPFLSALTAQHKWPFAIATVNGDAMLVRASTRRESPFGMDADYIGKRVPMLIAALGRAYLAFCPDDERETILAVLRASKARRNMQARDESAVNRMLAATRARGYATTSPVPNEPMMGFAVPVMEGERVIAAMTMRYFGSALTEEEAARRYLSSMQSAAEAIAATLTEGPAL
jgi:IclR family mhp operon transcriptional activator